jgi:2-amino-4-hydroxy-6-hydroxymethyldihydropteridine diphosphokinase
MAIVYFSLGSNEGDRLSSLLSATKLIGYQVGKLIDFSEIVETEPWGFVAETNFYNQILVVETQLLPHQVLKTILEIEKTLGRTRQGSNYSSRVIDIDILFYDGEHIMANDLKVPHPLLHKRNFVLQPLCTVAPTFVHPVLNATVSELFARLQDKSQIKVAFAKDLFANLLNPKT